MSKTRNVQFGTTVPAISISICFHSLAYGRGLGRRRGFRGGYGPNAGRGRGYGRGYGWYPPAAVPAYSAGTSDEMNMLKADADYMQKSLDAINKRIDELSVKPAEAS